MAHLGPDRCYHYSPRHRMPFKSWNEGLEYVFMTVTWRVISAWHYAVERCLGWEHPPTTLAACAAAWLASLVARVWMIPLLPSLCMLWLAGFTLPPLAQALGPTVGVALMHAAR